MINGSYWLGAAGGALAATVFLNTSLFAADFGWRLAFGIGAALRDRRRAARGGGITFREPGRRGQLDREGEASG